MSYHRNHAGLSWRHGPPRQSQAAEARSLGSYIDDAYPTSMRPGAPETLQGTGPMSTVKTLGLVALVGVALVFAVKHRPRR